jgi:hypothetical protein
LPNGAGRRSSRPDAFGAALAKQRFGGADQGTLTSAPGTITVFAQRWWSILPLPLTDDDRGYWWEISMRQIEVSCTIVFAQPRHARAFFEALVTDNLRAVSRSF